MTTYLFSQQPSDETPFLELLATQGITDVTCYDVESVSDEEYHAAFYGKEEALVIFGKTRYDFDYASFIDAARRFDGRVDAVAFLEDRPPIVVDEQYRQSYANRPESYLSLDVVYTPANSTLVRYAIPVAPKPFNGTPIERTPALFLDRDGILIEDTGYIGKPKDVRFLDAAIPLIRTAREKGYGVYVLTNQSGVARGRFTMVEVATINIAISERFAEMDAPIDGFYACPYLAEGTVAEFARESLWRKPHPGMALAAAVNNDIDLARSIMVGDKDSDVLRLPYLESFIIEGAYEVTKRDRIRTYDEIIRYLREK